jgi:hypothetical protein
MSRSSDLVAKFGESLGEPMTLRKLQYVHPTNEVTEVIPMIWRPFQIPSPEKNPNEDTWACFWQITGTIHDHKKTIYGVDAFQALELSLRLINSILDDISVKNPGKLLWDKLPYEDSHGKN